MSDLCFSLDIRKLSNDYYNQTIKKDDYRQQRKILLDKIDEEYNGRKCEEKDNNEKPNFMQTVSFVENKDIDKDSDIDSDKTN